MILRQRDVNVDLLMHVLYLIHFVSQLYAANVNPRVIAMAFTLIPVHLISVNVAQTKPAVKILHFVIQLQNPVKGVYQI